MSEMLIIINTNSNFSPVETRQRRRPRSLYTGSNTCMLRSSCSPLLQMWLSNLLDTPKTCQVNGAFPLTWMNVGCVLKLLLSTGCTHDLLFMGIKNKLTGQGSYLQRQWFFTRVVWQHGVLWGPFEGATVHIYTFINALSVMHIKFSTQGTCVLMSFS